MRGCFGDSFELVRPKCAQENKNRQATVGNSAGCHGHGYMQTELILWPMATWKLNISDCLTKDP